MRATQNYYPSHSMARSASWPVFFILLMGFSRCENELYPGTEILLLYRTLVISGTFLTSTANFKIC